MTLRDILEKKRALKQKALISVDIPFEDERIRKIRGRNTFMKDVVRTMGLNNEDKNEIQIQKMNKNLEKRL